MSRGGEPSPPGPPSAPADTATDWSTYLQGFHGERPGITEALLGRCVDADGIDPYRWLIQPLAGPNPGPGLVVDVGCGSGPTADHMGGWVGVDPSRAELGEARSRGRGPVVAATAERLPVASGSATAVVGAMALMVVGDPAATLAEAARVLQVGGRLTVLLPAGGPLSVADRVRYGLLLGAIGRTTMPFPHQDLGPRLGELARRAGLEVRSDDQARFGYPMRDRADGDRFVDSLYLPGISPRRIALARALTRRWGHGDLGIPLRRLVAVRAAEQERPSTRFTPEVTPPTR